MSNESKDSDKEESEILGSESRSSGMHSTGFSGLTRGFGITLGVMLSTDESCDGDRGSLELPYENIGKMGIGECTGDANISFVAKILALSWIDLCLLN